MGVFQVSTNSLNDYTLKKERFALHEKGIFCSFVFYCLFPSMHFVHINRTLENIFESPVHSIRVWESCSMSRFYYFLSLVKNKELIREWLKQKIKENSK